MAVKQPAAAQDRWENLGHALVSPIAIITFVAAWWHCASTYGFLFGFGLGWLPAAILAAIVGGLAYVAWPLVLFGFGLGILAGCIAVFRLMIGA